MRFFATATMLLAGFSCVSAAQDKPKPDGKYYVHRCTPKVVSQARSRRLPEFHILKGEMSTGYSPIVAFEILESGEVAKAFVKRSSGFTEVDNYALASVQGTKYNKRLGCGVIETQAVVIIDWR